MTPEAAQQVLDFWFGELDGDFPATDRSTLWWGANAATDAEVRSRFSGLHAAAEAGDLADWQLDPWARLALILLLDQFTRMLRRGAPDAFGNDAEALRLAAEGVERDMDRQLPLGMRVFFYMPFMHAEDLAMQARCVALFRTLAEETPAEFRAEVENNLKFAEEHRDVVCRFGRFPHRNRLLGRTSTPEEQAYLEGGGATWGQ